MLGGRVYDVTFINESSLAKGKDAVILIALLRRFQYPMASFELGEEPSMLRETSHCHIQANKTKLYETMRTYKEIAPAYQIKAFHRPGNVIVCVGCAHRHPLPPYKYQNIFSTDLHESQEWSWRPKNPRNSADPRRIPAPVGGCTHIRGGV